MTNPFSNLDTKMEVLYSYPDSQNVHHTMFRIDCQRTRLTPVGSEPPSWGSCNPWAVTSDGDHMTSASTITSKALGALICVVAVCYSAFNAASNSGALLGNDETPEEKKADEAGTPLVPKLESEAEDTTETVSYSFSLFHLAFALGAMYVAMLLTSWQVVDVDQNDKTGYEQWLVVVCAHSPLQLCRLWHGVGVGEGDHELAHHPTLCVDRRGAHHAAWSRLELSRAAFVSSCPLFSC